MQLDLKVDVLVMDLALPGGLDFIAAMRRSQKDIKVVGVVDDVSAATKTPGVNTIQVKPTVMNGLAQVHWLECIQKVLATSSMPVC